MDSLKHFVYRTQVIHLYRSYLRAARLAHSKSSRDGLVEEIRKEFMQNKDATDIARIRYLLTDGRNRLKQLEEMLRMQL